MRVITKISLIFILLILPVLSSAVPVHNHHNTAPSNNKETTCTHCCDAMNDSACTDGGQCQCEVTQASYSLRSPTLNSMEVSSLPAFKHGLPSQITSLFQDSLYRPPILSL